MVNEMYVNGEYFKKHPKWDVERSPWKARQILEIMARNNLTPKTICEVGCGAGKILSFLQQEMAEDCRFYGYEIFPKAFKLSRQKSNEKLNFRLKDILMSVVK